MSNLDDMYRVKVGASIKNILRAYANDINLNVSESKLTELMECVLDKEIAQNDLTEAMIELAREEKARYERTGDPAKSMPRFNDIEKKVALLKRTGEQKKKESKAKEASQKSAEFRSKMIRVLGRSIEVNGLEATAKYFVKWREISSGINFFTTKPSTFEELKASSFIEFAMSDVHEAKGNLEEALNILQMRILSEKPDSINS